MKKYLILAAAVSMFAACTNTDDLTQQIPAENERIPLTIDANYGENPNVTVRTRSTNQAIQGDTISRYVDMGLFVLTDGQTYVHQEETSPGSGTYTAKPYDYEFFNIEAKTSNIDGTNKRTEVGAKNSTTNALVYPSDKAQGINLYAYAPYNSAAALTDIDASTVATNVIDVSVLTDQSTDLNYIKSDVLWGCVGENAKGKRESYLGSGSGPYPFDFGGKPEAVINGNNYVAAKTAATDGFVQGTTTPSVVAPKVIIPMLHRAAKIVVILQVNGMPIDKLKGAKVIVQSPIDGELRIDNGTLTKKTGTTSSDIIMTSKLGYYIDYTKSPGDTGYETELAATDASSGATEGNNGVIAIDTDVPADGTKDKITGYVCSAIVMPHALATDAKLFDIQLADGTGGAYSTKYTYFNPSSFPTGGVSKFESGKVYTYTITVKASGLDVVATVANWADGGTDTGNAVLQ